MSGFIPVLATNIRRNFIRSFFSSIGIIIGIGSLYFFVTIGSGINEFIVGREMQKLPMNMLRIRTTELSLGVFRFGQPDFMRSATITENALESFRSIEGVRAIYPVMNVLFPISALLSFSSILPDQTFRQGYRTDLIMSGAPEELILEDIALTNAGFSDTASPIPVLLSRAILDIYNSGFAAGQNLPKLSEKALIGFQFDLTLGQSTLMQRRGARTRTVPCRVVGFTEKAEMLGLVMPLKRVQEFNQQFVEGWRENKYSSVYILAESSDRVAYIADEIEKTGYTVYAEKKLSNLIILITFILSLFSFVIIVVAAISIFNAFSVIVLQRRMEIGLYRSFGATRGTIRRLFMCEAGVVGSFTGIIGIILGVFLVRAAWSMAQKFLPGFLQTMDSIFPISFQLIFLLFAGAVVTSLIATYFPSLVASRTEISDSVRRT
ncbi:MAG: FtsX-like permease family protein [Spirochaetota bacterium]|jgi:ABC-type antimicrobial peptide transport system permease subunit|nr:FtsX-like permease family protein [Spirochaetota bacterium]